MRKLLDLVDLHLIGLSLTEMSFREVQSGLTEPTTKFLVLLAVIAPKSSEGAKCVSATFTHGKCVNGIERSFGDGEITDLEKVVDKHSERLPWEKFTAAE